MAKLEIREERNCLSHAHVSINFEADIRDWLSRLYETHNIFSDNVQSRGLIHNKRYKS